MKNICLTLALVLTLVTGFAAIPADTFASSAAKNTGTVEASVSDLIDINTADAATLRTLPGIGAKTAEAIMEYRKQHGDFQSLEDLQLVKGIGDKKLAKIKPLLKKI